MWMSHAEDNRPRNFQRTGPGGFRRIEVSDGLKDLDFSGTSQLLLEILDQVGWQQHCLVPRSLTECWK